MHYLCIALILLMTSAYESHAQFLSGKDAQVLVKGRIIDDNSGNPLAINIEFRTSDGKKIKTVSNSISGDFEQLLPSGEKYLVIFTSEEILRKEFEFQVEVSNKFIEQKVEWTAIRPAAGSRIFSGNIFKNGTAEISESGIASLKEIQMILRFNRSMYVNFEIGNNDNLASSRISVLNNYIESWTREKSRIELKTYSKKSDNKDFFVFITKISDFLNK